MVQNFAKSAQMDEERRALYAELAGRIGRTPLTEVPGLDNGNRLFLKQEALNPFGSHYDRVYLRLFEYYENRGRIGPGSSVLETTSGSAGVSFAGIGNVLGYDCHVLIPAGGERARERAIEELGATLVRTEESSYVTSFPHESRRYRKAHGRMFFLNHSMGRRRGTVNEVTLDALRGIADEITTQIAEVHYFVPAAGNGSSILGPARGFSPETFVVAFESLQSGAAYELMAPGTYEGRFGILPGSLPRNRLPGTSYPGIECPHLEISIESGVVNEVVLVGDRTVAEQYERATGRRLPPDIPRWDDEVASGFGRSTLAAIAVVRHLSHRVAEKNFVAIAYDLAGRYDN